MSRLVVGFLRLQKLDTAFSACNELKTRLRLWLETTSTSSLPLTLILFMLEQELNQNLLFAALALDHFAGRFAFLAHLLRINHGLLLWSLQPRFDNE